MWIKRSNIKIIGGMSSRKQIVKGQKLIKVDKIDVYWK